MHANAGGHEESEDILFGHTVVLADDKANVMFSRLVNPLVKMN